MRFLCDMGISRKVAEWLRRQGCENCHYKTEKCRRESRVWHIPLSTPSIRCICAGHSGLATEGKSRRPPDFPPWPATERRHPRGHATSVANSVGQIESEKPGHDVSVACAENL